MLASVGLVAQLVDSSSSSSIFIAVSNEKKFIINNAPLFFFFLTFRTALYAMPIQLARGSLWEELRNAFQVSTHSFFKRQTLTLIFVLVNAKRQFWYWLHRKISQILFI